MVWRLKRIQRLRDRNSRGTTPHFVPQCGADVAYAEGVYQDALVSWISVRVVASSLCGHRCLHHQVPGSCTQAGPLGGRPTSASARAVGGASWNDYGKLGFTSS